MLAIIGPAKTIDMSPHEVTDKTTRPAYLEDAGLLIDQLRQYSVNDLKKLLKVSDKLATLSFERIASWKTDYSKQESNQAILAFSGEVFNGLNARSLKEDDLLFSQKTVRILSGLYGILKPMDSILPYRLEMGTKIKNLRGATLYEYWKGIIPEGISRATSESGSEVLINLASNEYFKSIDPTNFPYRIISPVFKEEDGNGFRNVTIFAKKARGMMLRFILQNRISEPEELKAFDAEGYYFNPQESTMDEWWFCR
ncbi:peroxide stress protein YaaA [Bacteroidota bacterium]